jgi:CHAT domain-containing protein/tetratricopeptide (TPR) repeat protein
MSQKIHVLALAVGLHLATILFPAQAEDSAVSKVVARDDVPPMYADARISDEYAEYLRGIFKDGTPKGAVGKEIQHLLYRLCVWHFEGHNFFELFTCLDSVEASIARNGDPEIVQAWSSWSGGDLGINQAGGEFPLRARLEFLRAEALMEIGDYQAALRSAKAALKEHERTAPILWKDLGTTMNGLRKLHTANEMKQLPGLRGGGVPNVYQPTRKYNLPNVTIFQDRFASRHLDRLATLAVLFSLNGENANADDVTAEIENYNKSRFFGYEDKATAYAKKSALARIYMARKQYEQAAKYANEESFALQNLALIGLSLLLRDAGGIALALTDAHSLYSRFQFAHARIELGRFLEAKPYVEEILSADGIKVLAALYWAVLYDRGRIAEHEGKPDEAISYYQAAADEIERQRSTINTEGAKIGFFGDKQAVYQALVRLLFQTGKYEEAFLVGERSKSRALVDMLAHKQDFQLPAQSSDKINLLLARSQVGEVALSRNTAVDAEVVARLSQRSVGQNATDKVDVRALVEEARNLNIEARNQLAEAAPELASLVSVTPISLTGIRQALPVDETLLSYYYDAQHLYAFVIDGRGLHAVELRRSGLEDDIQALRQAIPKRDGGYMIPARALYGRLVQPLADKLTSRKLLVAGHGVLHYLPFASLMGGEQFLIDRYRLSFLPSASTLKYVGKIRTGDKPGSLLAFGNPDLGDRMYDLEFSQKEAQDIGKLFEKSAVFLGKDASKQNLKEYGAGFRYLHFATHGKFDAANPLGSALMLASNSVSNERDRLTIGELYSMRFDADLVTLSACETGLGKVANGDDVVGMVRGFLYAGANQIVSTLWEIDDAATSTLMTNFYKRIKAGTGMTDALRESQLAIRKNYPDPFYWAAFQITGGEKQN